jgi:hypothetical protein
MEQIMPLGRTNFHKDRGFKGKSEDPQKIANLFGKAIDDLDIILFQKGQPVANFSEATKEERELITQTKVKAAYIVLTINKELELIQFDLMDAQAKTKLSTKLQEIKEQMLKAKENKSNPIESLSVADISFLHKVFNKRFEKKLKEINDSSKIALAN